MTLDTVIKWLREQREELDKTIKALEHYKGVEQDTREKVKDLLTSPRSDTRSASMKRAWERRRLDPDKG
jgi:hypothetical protein